MFTVLRPGHLSDGGALTISSNGVRFLCFCLQLQIYYYYYYYYVSTCEYLLISVFVCCLLFMYFTPVSAVSP